MASLGTKYTLTADGQSAEFSGTGGVRVSVSGTFGGGTVKIQAKDPRSTWVDITNASWTEAVDKLLDFPLGADNILRVDISGSTSPSVVVWFQGSDR